MSYIKTCPMCGPYGHCTGRCPAYSIQPTFAPITSWNIPKGCICPPGSETTCLRKDCGRKDPDYDIPAMQK